MPTKTISETYPKAQALALISVLIDESRWLQVEPEPFDVYRITVKAEAKLPQPMGVDNAGASIDFETWIALVGHAYSEITDEGKDEFRDHFVRGLSPAEAIAADHAEAE